ncbi:hypothetical protein [Streptomyces sp. H39-S7]|uniref:hypothetical protein n=1 Tax=Streptomyces sp. H39-S7 TaxID=3004357 RepID=UPI0022AEEF2A|nr:hypothetical protein [Streptomyces sp. H39-S7]MCZ4125386.1 hypothetical protein [Streptomyces sp. H39-S7]
MKLGTFNALAELCGTHLLRAVPEELEPLPEFMPDASCAVYIAVDSRGHVGYVGSVCRPKDGRGLSSHVREYLDTLPKTDTWVGIYALLLHPDTPEPEVRRIGGDIAGWLLPYDRERWPRAS